MDKNSHIQLIGSLDSDCQIKIYNHEVVRSMLTTFIDKDLSIEISIHKPKRSERQNRWYWGIAIRQCILPFIKETTGETFEPEEIHAFHLKEIINVKFKTRTILGKTVMIFDDVSTSSMNTKQFAEFKDKIQQHWAEKGCVIPDPVNNSFLNEYDRINNNPYC
jgi:hypothetical protein